MPDNTGGEALVASANQSPMVIRAFLSRIDEMKT